MKVRLTHVYRCISGLNRGETETEETKTTPDDR